MQPNPNHGNTQATEDSLSFSLHSTDSGNHSGAKGFTATQTARHEIRCDRKLKWSSEPTHNRHNHLQPPTSNLPPPTFHLQSMGNIGIEPATLTQHSFIPWQHYWFTVMGPPKPTRRFTCARALQHRQINMPEVLLPPTFSLQHGRTADSTTTTCEIDW